MNDRQRLEAIIAVVCKYLPPDGISREDAMSEIIELVDPLPEQFNQEPVAYADALDLAKNGNWDTFICKHSSENHEGTRFKIPIYTDPPKREWVGLTDDEIEDTWGNTPMMLNARDGGARRVFARAIEAKLKEKNA